LKAKKTYLKGQSVFIVSLFVIGITLLTVYLTGVNYHRTITTNLYLSLSIIGTALFVFMTYGLYKGIGLADNFPKFRNFKSGEFISSSGEMSNLDVPVIITDDGIGGIILSILLWIGMAIFFFILLVLLDAIFWVSVFIILAMLYWVFFRALRLVFSKSSESKGDLGISTYYSLLYSALYLGWIFGIVYLTEILT
jgi:hypothetical protein